jgi:hypothetical protein
MANGEIIYKYPHIQPAVESSPFRDIYFDRYLKDDSTFVRNGNYTYIFILSGIGILLLLTGLVNYLNIHSVVMTRRNRELGMKKVFGAEGYRVFILLLTLIYQVYRAGVEPPADVVIQCAG